MTAGRRKTRVVTKLHPVKKRVKTGDRWYIYAWRGGPCIHIQDGAKPVITPDILDKQRAAKLTAATHANSFDRVIDDYRESPEFASLSASTKRDYRLWLNRVSERFGKAPIAAFADPRMRGDIKSWRNTWKEQPRTADKAAGMMSTLLSWAVEDGRLPANIASGIKTLHRADKSEEIWEDRHWEAVKDVPAHIMDALTLASLTGLRLSDLVALDWNEVGDKAIIRVTNKRKGRAVIPILRELRTFLDSREHRKGAVLLNSRGKPWTPSGLESSWQKKQPKGFDRTIHDLRGTFATKLILAGLTDDQAAMIMGWRSNKVAQIRARYVNEERVIIDLAEQMGKRA